MRNLNIVMTIRAIKPLALIAAGSVIFFVSNDSAATDSKKQVGEIGKVVIADRTWAGIPVNISAISVGNIVYIGYYDAERQLSVARIDTSDGSVQRKRLDSTFAGWDAHNFISLTYDRNGFLHVAGNMHAVPLIYARMFDRDRLDSLRRVDSMIGEDESHVTYPKFFKFPDGALGFTYRQGKSGDGVEIINRFDGKSWSRLSDRPIFAPAPGDVPVSAYHTDYILGQDGYFHTAWVWRLTKGVENNFNVNYAKSKDLKQWFGSTGKPISSPLTPANSDVVDKVPPHSGLFNNVKLGFNGLNEPVISYLKYDEDGHTQLYHARPTGAGWQIEKITSWESRWDFMGGGTKIQQISFSAIRSENGKVTESVRHFKDGASSIIYVADGMKSIKISLLPAALPSDCLNLKPWRQVELPISATSSNSYKGKIVWRALPPGNADLPRSCSQLGLETGCNMSSNLMVVPQAYFNAKKDRLLACNQ